MSLEQAIEKLITAVEANTAAHAQLAEVAKAAGAQKTAKVAVKTPADDAGEDEVPAKASAKKAPAKASDQKAPAKAKEPTLSLDVDAGDVRGLARTFLGSEDEAERDDRKQKFSAALKHLGAKKLTEVDDEDQPKLFAYMTYWAAGLEVDFEEIDAKLAELSPGEGDEDEGGDDMLG